MDLTNKLKIAITTVQLYVIWRAYRKRKAKHYVCPVNVSRFADGVFHSLLLQLRTTDPERHFQYFRMTVEALMNYLILSNHTFSIPKRTCYQ